MRVQVIPFGVLKDWLGASATTVELPDGASVAVLLEGLRGSLPAGPAGAAAGILGSIAVSVNAEYAQAAHILHDGDEVGLLPPVSGGAPVPNAMDESCGDENVHVALTRDRLDAEKTIAAAKNGEDGAVVVFDGIVRNNTRGRRTLHLDYEAYEEMALSRCASWG